MVGSLLFVRDVQDVPQALQTVNQLLSRREPSGFDDSAVLGVVVAKPVDTHLPEALTDTPIALRDSVAMSGIWSLCRFDLDVATDLPLDERRRRLLDTVAPPPAAPDADGSEAPLFIPVLADRELRQQVESLRSDLDARYPAMAISGDFITVDAARGGLALVHGAEARGPARMSS